MEWAKELGAELDIVAKGCTHRVVIAGDDPLIPYLADDTLHEGMLLRGPGKAQTLDQVSDLVEMSMCLPTYATTSAHLH